MFQTVNQTRVEHKTAFSDRFCVRHLFDLCLRAFNQKNCSAVFGAAGGRFYVSKCKLNKSLTQNAFSVRPLFDLQFASEPYTKRIITLFLKQQEAL